MDKQHSFEIDDEFVANLNREALFLFIYCDETSQNDEGGVVGIMKHYHHATILDMSPMLSGHTIISRTFGEHSTAEALATESANAKQKMEVIQTRSVCEAGFQPSLRARIAVEEFCRCFYCR